MGLGLAICFTVIENHGGKLGLIKSDSDGSIFELAIPVGGQHSAEEAQTTPSLLARADEVIE
jgi:K+-sensing histidine kinase KdpD